MKQTCTDHCGACGRHFHGLTAFEAHRRNFECVDPPLAVSDRGRQLLQAWTDDGWCSLEADCFEDGQLVRWAHPVTVWQLVPTEAGTRFLAERHSEPNSPSRKPETPSVDVLGQGRLFA